MNKQIRVEISFKDLNQLKNKIDFLLNKNIYKINIPCKGLIKKDFLLEVVKYLGTNYKEIEVVYHYSLFHQYSKDQNNSLNHLLKFIKLCRDFDNREILLVSGSRKKNNFEVTNILPQLKDEDIKFGVAYNPYFINKNDINLERNNLIKKVNSGLVNSIWLQFGSNLEALKKEIKFIKKNISDKSNILNSDIKLYGSILVPSKQFLARFKFRPWKGVYLNHDFLNSLEFSTSITKEIYKFYCEKNIIPLVETECCTLKQFNEVRNLFQDIY